MDLSLEGLRQYILNNGGKVRSSDAVEHFRNNYLDSGGNAKEVFKSFMEELTSAQVLDGDRWLVLKRHHQVTINPTRTVLNSPHLSSLPSPRLRGGLVSPRVGGGLGSPMSASLRSPRQRKLDAGPRSPTLKITSPLRSPKCHRSLPSEALDKFNSPSASTVSSIDSQPQQTVTDGNERDPLDRSLSPVSGYESDDMYDMELGSVGGCSSVQLEANQKEWMYRTAIGDLDAVTRLLLTDGERLLVKNKDFTSGYTGLHWACKLGREDMVRVLLMSDSDVNAKSNSGMTPLHIAAQCGYDAIINILIANKADISIRDYCGKHPIYYLSPSSSSTTRHQLTPPVFVFQKPSFGVSITDVPPPASSTPVKSEHKSFTLRRYKHDKSDERYKTISSIKYTSLNKQSHKRSLSGIKIDHTTMDGSDPITLVRTKDEALESMCSSPRSVKRISIIQGHTMMSLPADSEPLLAGHFNNGHTNWSVKQDKKKRGSRLLCCCHKRTRKSSL